MWPNSEELRIWLYLLKKLLKEDFIFDTLGFQDRKSMARF